MSQMEEWMGQMEGLKWINWLGYFVKEFFQQLSGGIKKDKI